MPSFSVKLRALGLSACLAVGTLTAAGTSAAAAPKPIHLEINGSPIEPAQQPFMENGSVFIPLRTVSELLKTVVDWNAKSKTVSIYAPEHTVKLVPGQKNVQHNGQSLQMTQPAKLKNGSVYVPIRFVAQTLGATVDWQSAKNTVAISDEGKFVMGWATSDTPAAFWANIRTGELYQSYPSASPAKLTGKLDSEFVDKMITLSANQLSEDGFVVTVTNYYGEPMVHQKTNTSYVKGGKLLREAEASYFQRMAINVNQFRNQPLLTDGKTLELLKQDGTVDTAYDLVKLGTKDESYSIEGIGDGYLLIRPNATGLLTLVDPVNGYFKLLYELLGDKDREYALMNDVPYHGDTLVVQGEHDGTIDLEYTGIVDNAIHKLQVKAKDWLK
ncbi:copper amine oxidase N-terminal domain-containing protein [Cohnella sp. REN36]|uniref:copper amine oxidase N-terminal domain-containing protein n=2 Tax=Paenibacillaceae TaxID=186822 RepID=UPI001D153235|nr:copper amine oxidase N-terminal domain-containing protein [Cohnella sp. REN36]MCC3377248.1 copper amine oxidase N-terminal domain-containing protein [Cohnella sp. REN36]